MGIISIYGPPGSGKTSLAIDLAFANAQQGRSVCLISAEAYSELSAVLQLHITKKNSLQAAYLQPGAIQQATYQAAELLYVLSVPVGNDAFAFSENSVAVKQVLTQTRDLYDVVIVDCSSSAESALAAWAQRMSDHALVMTGCRPRDGEWHKSYRRGIWEIMSKVKYVCAEIREDFDYQALFALIGAEPEVILPFVPGADARRDLDRTLYRAGSGLLCSRAEKKALQHYSEAIDKLKNRLEVYRA